MSDDKLGWVAPVCVGYGVVCLLVLIIIFFTMISNMPVCVQPEQEIPIIYDSASSELQETTAFCPVCGSETIALNDEIVCRNEDCQNYGLAVSIEIIN